MPKRAECQKIFSSGGRAARAKLLATQYVLRNVPHGRDPEARVAQVLDEPLMHAPICRQPVVTDAVKDHDRPPAEPRRLLAIPEEWIDLLPVRITDDGRLYPQRVLR